MSKKRLTIPEVRNLLDALANEIENDTHGVYNFQHAKTLRKLIGHLYRRTPLRSQKQEARPVRTLSRQDRLEIYNLWQEGYLNRDIGRRFKIDGGRVTEIVRGFR